MSKAAIWGFSKLLGVAGIELKGATRLSKTVKNNTTIQEFVGAVNGKPANICYQTTKNGNSLIQEVLVNGKKITNSTNFREGNIANLGEILENGESMLTTQYSKLGGKQLFGAAGKMELPSKIVKDLDNIEGIVNSSRPDRYMYYLM